MQNENRLTVHQAAKLLGASDQFVRIGIREGQLKFGVAVKTSNQWTYLITKQKFEEVTGITVPEILEA